MRAPLIDTNSGFYQNALQATCGIFQKAQQQYHEWQEIDAMINVIVPLLTILNFGHYTLTSKKAPFSQSSLTRHRPDYEVRSLGRVHAILEAKRFNADLHGGKSSSGYIDPLDQILTYLDHYDNVFGFLTNGRQWYVIKRLQWIESTGEKILEDYVGMKFDLSSSYSIINAEAFLSFLSICLADRLFARAWPETRDQHYIPLTPRRTDKVSILHLKDFSNPWVGF